MGTTLNEEKKYVNQESIDQALQALKNQQAAKPGEYQSPWQSQISEMMDKILNREQFQYDLNGDALYQQYKDQHITQGQKAMMDTMGQAQAMTGGYGNSYAQTAGQQAYQGYLQQLGDKIPELYQLALNKYNQDGQNMLNQYGLMVDQDNLEYGRHQDSVNNWQNEYDRLLGEYYTERDFGYQQDRYQVADAQWQKEFEEAVRQYNQKNGVSSSSSSSSSSKSTSGSTTTKQTTTPTNYNNQGYSTDVVKQAQAYVGATADGYWGAASVAAAQKAGFQSLADVVKRVQRGGQQKPASFSGSTYNEAVSYLKANGKPTGGIMTQSEWQRHRNNALAGKQTNAEGSNYSTYAAYLRDFVAYLMK